MSTRGDGRLHDWIVQHAQVDSAEIDIPFALDQTLDLVGLQHHISSGSAVPSINAEVEAWAQIWRDIGEPAFDSLRVSHDSVTLFFVNNSGQRAIDSTLVQHLPDGSSSWSPRGSVGGEAVTFIDTLVSPGDYTYRLKHVADAVLGGSFQPAPPRPNSGWVDTTLTVPGFPAPTTFWCDDDLAPSVTCHWQNGADTAAIQMQRDGVVRDTVAAGGSTWEDGQVVNGVAYQYRVRHLSPDAVSDWTQPWSLTVEPNPPVHFVCTSSEGMIGCGWNAGEVNDTTEVHRKPQGTSTWSFLAKVTPGQTYYHDYNVEPDETWCYRARHRRQATTTVWVGPACATVHGDPGPLPGRRGRQ